ncbi:MAG TPA: class I SAM-dependent methyltransferase [Aestuariivirgaceae bacterium]|nr:class I SAM-dependent methyltransferase [Aestuariivirgaceae bacterium]
MSGAGVGADAGLQRLVAWGQARAPRRALDVAGGGHTALAFAAVAPQVIAVDVEAELTAARRILGRAAHNVRLVAGDVAALPFDNGAFDLVTCRLAAHRFPHAALAVREIQRVLAPGGSLLLAEPLAHDDNHRDAVTAGVLSPRTPLPLRAYRRPEWHAFLRAAGLTTMEEDTIVTAAGTPADFMILLRAEKD